MLVCWWWWFDRSFAQFISPVVTTTSIILCFNKHQLTQIHLEKGRLNGQREREREIHGTHSYWKQGALCAAVSGVKVCMGRSWAAAWIFMAPTSTGSKARRVPQARRKACMGWSWTAACGTYRGTSWQPPAYSLFKYTDQHSQRRQIKIIYSNTFYINSISSKPVWDEQQCQNVQPLDSFGSAPQAQSSSETGHHRQCRTGFPAHANKFITKYVCYSKVVKSVISWNH